MLDRADRALSLRRHCALLGVARSGVYRPVKPANDNGAALMRRIDERFTAWPFLSSPLTKSRFFSSASSLRR
jgi:putative transposase